MKRFVAVLLCIIIPFLLVVPVKSNALDIQGNEYPTPLLFPPDFDFSEYDYYFLTVSGTPENPSYLLYVVKDKSNTGRLYFSVTKELASTRINNGVFTSYDITTDYEVKVSSYSNSTGMFGGFSTLNSARSQGFVFDGYSTFSTSSSCRYIIGCNTDIYSYFGVNVRSGDYDNLNLFFLGGLKGTSDKTEKPTEPTTSGSSSGSGGIDIDLSFLSDYFNRIFELLESVIGNFTTLISNIGKLTDVFGTSEDGSIFLHLSVMKNTLVDFFNSANTKLDEIKTEILNFEKYFSEFSAVNGEIANIFTVLNGLNINITNIHTKTMEIIEVIKNVVTAVNNFDDDILPTLISMEENINSIKNNVANIRTNFYNFLLNFPTDFDDIINSIKSNVSNINTKLSNFLLNFPTDFKDIIKSIDNHTSSIRTDLHNFLLNFSIDSLFGDISLKIDDLIDDLKLSVDSLFDDISVKFDSINVSGLISAIEAVETAVNNLPDSIEEVLKYLFIPTTKKPEELIEMIEEHFEFVYQLAEIGDVVFQPDNFENKVPEYVIKFDSDLFGHFEGKIIDFSIIPYDYIQWFKMLVSGITCYFFFRKVRKRLPSIINGGFEL